MTVQAIPTLKPCSSCGTRVWWLRHPRTHKLAPIEEILSLAGNIEVRLQDGEYDILTGRRLAEAREHGVPLHVNHFANCKDAQAWRRPS